MLSVRDREALWRFWPEIQYDTIAVGFLDLLRMPSLLELARRHGIKQALGFKGTVIGVLIGDNSALDSLKVDSYVADVRAMGFDAATTYDDYLYVEDPENYRWSRIHNLLRKAERIVSGRLDCEIIGLAKGTNRDEISFCLRHLKDLGLNKVVFPCSGHVKLNMHSTVRNFCKLARDQEMWPWLIGINSIHRMRLYDAGAYTGKAWSYGAARGQAYVDGTLSYPRELACHHELCRRLKDSGTERHIRYARHNLLSLIEQDRLLRRGEYGWAY
jgi:hypothetical protein